MDVDRLQADDPSSKAALPHKAAAMSGDTKREVGLRGGGRLRRELGEGILA